MTMPINAKTFIRTAVATAMLLASAAATTGASAYTPKPGQSWDPSHGPTRVITDPVPVRADNGPDRVPAVSGKVVDRVPATPGAGPDRVPATPGAGAERVPAKPGVATVVDNRRPTADSGGTFTVKPKLVKRGPIAIKNPDLRSRDGRKVVKFPRIKSCGGKVVIVKSAESRQDRSDWR